MANDVFANGREVSCKKADGKSICAFPDVCMTPPENPATPPGVPVPYPNTGMAKDTTQGSKTVKISTNEVMLKNKSYFKKSTGDEAGSAAKKGVITSVNRGKVYFKSWSMDVKIEGENVVRHLDLTTHNHASEPPQTPPWMHVDTIAKSVRAVCADEIDEAEKACKGKSRKKCGEACRNAQKCLLVPKGKDKKACCNPHTTGHHMIEDHWVKGNNGFATAQKSATPNGYKAAPTVCANRFRSKGTVHRRLHDIQGTVEESFMPGGGRAGKKWDYGAGKKAALIAHKEVFASSGCQTKCLEAQLDDFYGKDESRPLNKPHKQALGSVRDALKKIFGRPRRFTL